MKDSINTKTEPETYDDIIDRLKEISWLLLDQKNDEEASAQLMREREGLYAKLKSRNALNREPII